VNTDLSILSLIIQASLLVQFVMLMLLVASIISWAFIFQRAYIFKRSEAASAEFDQVFWSGIELSKLYSRIAGQREPLGGLENIFMQGFKEFSRLRKQAGLEATAVMEGVQRVLRVAVNREVEQLEAHLGFLATVGSVSPYVGLFGTVWGIMNSFRALGTVQQATLSMVAPGISEALIATAMGLFAAIPAVIAYNRYSQRAQYLSNGFATFAEEFLSILHRQAYAHAKNIISHNIPNPHEELL